MENVEIDIEKMAKRVKEKGQAQIVYEYWKNMGEEARKMKEDLLREWQHRLGLDNWHIVLKDEVSPNDMQLQGCQGETEYDTVNRCAVIRILNEKDYGDRILPFDKEKVLVHELLHIKMWFIYESDCDLQSKMVHQLIDDMARALVDAKRRVE